MCAPTTTTGPGTSEGRWADDEEPGGGGGADSDAAVGDACVVRGEVALAELDGIVAELEHDCSREDERRFLAGMPTRLGCGRAARLERPAPDLECPLERGREELHVDLGAREQEPPGGAVADDPGAGRVVGEEPQRCRAERLRDVAQRVERRVDQATLDLAQKTH